MNTDLITVETNERFIILTLNQPETLNAFSKDMILTISNYLKSLNEEGVNKPLIITGSGRAFSSGGNLGVMKTFVEKGAGLDYIQSIVPFVNELITLLLEYKGSTLAIVNGSAVGGGFNLAMACDFRIVHEKAKFRLGFIDIGLTPATGNSFFVTKVLGIPKTLSLSLLSESFTAKDLYTWGLANEIYSDTTSEDIKQVWIEKLCSLDTWQVFTVRSLLYAGYGNSYLQQLDLEYATIQKASTRPLFKERVLSLWDKIQSKKK